MHLTFIKRWRCLKHNEHNIKDFAKTNNTEHSDNVLNLTDSDGFCTQQDSVRQRCFGKTDSIVNKTVRDIDLSDSNLLRNCENIFKEPSEKSIPKKVITRSKQKRHSSVNLQKRFMKNNKPTHCQEEIIKQGKVVCGLESTEEFLVVPRPWNTKSQTNDHTIRMRMKRGSTEPEDKKLLLMIKETVIRWQMTC